MSNEQTGGTGQTTTGEGTDVKTDDVAKKLTEAQEALNKAISERDSFKTKFRDAESASAGAKKLQEDLDAERAAKTKLEGDFNTYKDGIKQEKLGTHLSTALEAAGAKSISTVLKLLDKSKIEFDEEGNVKQESVASVIEALKVSDPVLFGEVSNVPKKESSGSTTGSPPTVKVAAGGVNTQSAYETEMKAAKTQADVERIARKYNVK